MKPMLQIVSLTEPKIDKISLEKYRLLKNALIVLLLPPYGKWPEEMKKEGIEVSLIKLNELSDTLEKRTEGESGGKRLVLAIPAYVLPESFLIKNINSLVKDYYDISLQPLPSADRLDRLISIMAELRSIRGCPWDKEQTHQSLKKYLIEETYEVIDAIDKGDLHNLCEELGDLLLQVVFHAQIAAEKNNFTMDNIIEGISEKLIRRHPHVFGDIVADTSAEVLENWDKIKVQEKEEEHRKRERENDYFNIPSGLPALMYAEKTQKKAAKIGFDWQSYEGPLAKVEEERTELAEAIELGAGVEDELGDLLFSIVNLSRFLQVDSEEALRYSTQKFQGRFIKMLKLIQEKRLNPEHLELKEMDIYWEEAKNEGKNSKTKLFCQ
jgi:tetrapyrrole methylase family protein/MazG family protein